MIPEYMREYRKTHPLYREKERERNRINARRFRTNWINKLKRETISEILEKVRKIHSTYLHQRDFIERTEVLEVIKTTLKPDR